MKINIVGGGYGNELVPHNETVWGFNDWLIRGHADLIFDMHNLPEVLAGKQMLKRRTVEQVKAGIERVIETNTPMYSLEAWDDIPCYKYPLKEISEKFKTDYFTSGVAYAIAFSIYQGVSQLHLYGISLGISHEYSFQKPCVEFWIGMARGMGIEVCLFGESEVLKSANRKLYGYNTKQGAKDGKRNTYNCEKETE